MTETVTVTCAQPSCQIAKGGKCLEGLATKDCPHFGKPLTEAVQEKPTAQVSTRLGEGLAPADVDVLLAEIDAQVVVIAGNSNSGKTTLVTSLYETFLGGEFAGRRFAGSRTLFGFEQRLFMNRGGYGFEQPDTPRTPVSNPSPFLHLRLQPTTGTPVVEDLLLVDVSGERFSRAGDSPTTVVEVAGIARADALVLLLDGERLADLETRHSVVTTGRQVLAACFGPGGCGPDAKVHIVIAKLDILEGNQDALAFVTKKLQELTDFCKTQGRMVTVHRIAARPKSAEVQVGQGMQDLLLAWLAPVKMPVRAVADVASIRAFVYGGAQS